jgi:hypothetical protein
MKRDGGCKIPAGFKAEPSYADGYYDAFHGYGFDTDRADDEPYAWGFEAGDRAVKLFEGNGFRRQSGGGFQISFPVAVSPTPSQDHPS